MKRILGIAAASFALVVACGSDKPAKEPARPASQAEALVAFETVRQVLQNPRCQNCHPSGDEPLQGDEGVVHTQNVKRGPKGEGFPGEECSTCHGPANPPSNYGMHIPPGNVKGWHMPDPSMKLVFVGKSPHDLCVQVKDPAQNGGKTGDDLIKHLDDPLVMWGWDPGFGRKPVPIPHDQYKAAWKTWWQAGAPCP